MMDKLFNEWLFGDDGYYGYSNSRTPAVDITENKDAYIFEMDLPGRSEKDINIELKDDILTVESAKQEKSAENKENKENENKFLIHERRHPEFVRRFTLPNDVSSDNVSAEFKNGVLTIRIEKSPKTAPKRIEIKAIN